MEAIGITSPNPTVRFHLEPGEPGFLREAPALQSTINVVSQELRVLNRKRNRALRQGQAITQSGVTYRVDRRGKFLTVIDGTTTVKSQELSTKAATAELREFPEGQVAVRRQARRDREAAREVPDSPPPRIVPTQASVTAYTVTSDPQPPVPVRLIDVTV